jgi:hypothetical protein
VLLDKNADCIIADHAMRNANPLGALSWKWIDESVKKGKLLLIEDYQAGPPEKTIRAGGVSQSGRTGRTPFTAADDDILMRWVTQAERQGKSVKGNEIYKQLEAKYPRHTYQSWRDRWIKNCSNRARPPLQEDEEQSDDAPAYVPPVQVEHISRSTTNATANSRPGSVSSEIQNLPTNHSKKAASDPLPRTSSHRPVRPVKLATENEFTEEEDQELLDNSKAILDLDPDQAIDAWMNWAIQYPSHSAQEWRNRFKNHTRQILAKKKYENEEEEEQQETVAEVVKHYKRSMPVKKGPEKGQGKQKTAAKFVEDHSFEEQLLSRAKKPSITRQLFTGSKSKVMVPTEAHSRALAFRDSKELIKISDSPSDTTTTEEKLFRIDLQALANDYGLEVNFNPEICGRRIPLFRLWQVVTSVEFGGFDEVDGRKLWSKIAKKLKFNEYKDPLAPSELRDCYSEILVDFEVMLEEWQAEQLDAAESEAESDRTLLPGVADKQQEEVEEDEGLFVQSSKNSSSVKRGIERDTTSRGVTFNKKPRLDKGKGRAFDTPTSKMVKEIPSTPEDVLNGNAFSSGIHNPSSPIEGQSSLSPTEAKEAADFEVLTERWRALGYDEYHVAVALHATGLVEANLGEILESLHNDQGIPDNIRGVWTGSDDERLNEDEDTQAFLTVLRKHGQEFVEKRRRYLEQFYAED